MATTNFIDGTTIIIADWLNDIDAAIYQGAFGAVNLSTTGTLSAGAITATSFGGITSANLVDKSAAETISGAWTFTGAFTSLGIDDNATAEYLAISDASLTVGTGVSASQTNILNSHNDGFLQLGGGSNASGANILFYGGAHGNTGDFLFRNDSNVWMAWDESDGDLEILTGVGAKTSALTLDSSQNATFTGDVTATGDVIVGDGTSAAFPIRALGEDGRVDISGGTNQISSAAIQLLGGSHADKPNYLRLKAAGATFLEWQEDVGAFVVNTGVGGTKTLALTLDSSQNATFAGDVQIDGTSLTAASLTSAILGNYTLDTDQTVGVGQDNFVLTYDDASGEISLTAGTPGPAGSFYNYTLQSGTSYTAVASDFVVASNTGTVTITLPSGHSVNETIIVKKTGSGGTVTVDANASETIDGALTHVLATQYESITLISDGTNWLIV